MAQNQAQSLVGRQVGPYKIHSLLGAGGMGEVYLAQDPRLDRIIALKILPAGLASDPARIQRFIREARAASGLKHPNVATIYEIGKSDELHFIAMEYVEGKTVADKISGRPLPIGEIVDIGIQVADALDEAHRKGITHRDIKPANLMLTSREQVKILDFGLAKIARPEGQPIGSDVSTVVKTETGVVMGTVQYMSPEQVLGREVDHRTDIFSLGVVLYETATGRLPFTGTSSSETMDRVLHGQPEAIARFNYNVPPELERIIRKCLEKDRERRYQLARDVRADLSSLKEKEAADSAVAKSPASSQSAAQRKRSWTALGAGVGLIALVAASAGLYFFRRQPVSTELPSPPIPLTSYPGTELSPSFSPDGNQVAFSWDGDRQDNFDIYVKLIDRVEYHRLTSDPARDMSPAWSPDGRTIAFAREGAVYLITPIGGRERKLADVRAADIDWTADSRSLIVSGRTLTNFRLLGISVDSGQTTELTSPPGQGLGIGDFSLAVSPDGLKVAFVRIPAAGSADLYMMPVSSGELRRLTQNEGPIYGLTWTADGREVVYSAQASLGRRSVESRFDSPPTRVEGVDPAWATAPAISRPTSGSPVRLAYERLVLDTNIWVKDTHDHSTPARKLIGWTRGQGNPQFSPDGHQIAFLSNISGSYQIWIANSDGSNPWRLTSLSTTGVRNSPRWSPDGRQIVFAWIQNNNRDLYSISVNGTSLRQLTKEPSHEGRPSWSRDGRWIYCYSDRTGRNEIWRIPAEGRGEASQLTTDGGHESFESPDGKLLYYEDYGDKGLKSIPLQADSGPREGSVVLEKVRPGFWAVTEKGIYFVEFDDRYAASQFIQYAFVVGTTGSSLPIKFYDFQSRKITQIGAIEKGVIRHDPGFTVTWDGRTMAWSQIDRGESDLMMVENFR